jgi:hypothetical protein
MRFARFAALATACAAFSVSLLPTQAHALKPPFSQTIPLVEMSYSTALNPFHPLIEGDFR